MVGALVFLRALERSGRDQGLPRSQQWSWLRPGHFWLWLQFFNAPSLQGPGSASLSPHVSSRYCAALLWSGSKRALVHLTLSVQETIHMMICETHEHTLPPWVVLQHIYYGWQIGGSVKFGRKLAGLNARNALSIRFFTST